MTGYVLNLAELHRMADLDSEGLLHLLSTECDGPPFNRLDSTCGHPKLSTSKLTSPHHLPLPMAISNDQGNFMNSGWGKNSSLSHELSRKIVSSRNRDLWDRFDKEGSQGWRLAQFGS